MKKKIVSLLLIAAMAVSVVACGSEKEESNATQGASSEESTKVSEESEAAESTTTESEEPAVEEITYPLDTDVSLSIFSNKWQLEPHSDYADYTESPFHMGLAENTGVDMEWIVPALGEDQVQAYNMMLSEDELPNLIFTGYDPVMLEQLYADGVIYDLTEYIPIYAPDYWALINQPEYADVLSGLQSEDGRMYMIGQFSEQDYNSTYCGPVIRQDWLDECGLDAPVTMEDWEEVLVAFKEKYGATLGIVLGRFNFVGIGSGTGAYGTFTDTLYVDDDGKIQLAQAQPEWKEYMEWLHKWYDMGLIDPDFATLDDGGLRTKVLNNEIGVSFTAMSQFTNWCNDAVTQETGAEWVGLEYPRTAEGEPTCYIQTRTKYYGWGATITTDCSEEELILALKWLNYGYTDEGIMYWNYGTEGETYTIDANGDVQWTDLIAKDPAGTSDATKRYTGTYGTGISVQLADYVALRNAEPVANAIYKWIENTDVQKHFIPWIANTDEENMIYTDVMSQVSTYVKENGLKFVTGERSLDEFDAYVSVLYDQMNLQDALDVKQAAYDRYMAK